LMTLRAALDFTADQCGRLLLTNEPLAEARQPAPRVWLGQTADGRVLRIGAAVPEATATRVTAIVEALPTEIDDGTLTAIRTALEADAPVTQAGWGLAFRFPAGIAVPPGVIPLTAANRELAGGGPVSWLRDEIDDWQPCFAVVRNGDAVSVCYSSRSNAGAAEAGVDTLDGHRGHGYATAVTLAWAAAIQASGRIPIYSCAAENLASRGVARRVEATQFGRDWTWT
jgi:hypothetical protein